MFAKRLTTGIILAVVLCPLVLVQAVKADPTTFSVNSYTYANLEGPGEFIEDFTITSYEWGTTDYLDLFPNDGQPDPFFSITVNSGPSPSMLYDHQITFDYSGYGLEDFLIHEPTPIPFHELTLTNIKQPGDSSVITDVTALDVAGMPIGTVSTDGNSIFFHVTVADLWDGGMGDFVAIHFSQATVPAPGALAMLTVGGIAMRRRRRNV